MSDPRNELASLVARIYDYPHGCPGEHGNSQQVTYLFDALVQCGWSAPTEEGEYAGSPMGEWEQTAADQLPPASTTGSNQP